MWHYYSWVSREEHIRLEQLSRNKRRDNSVIAITLISIGALLTARGFAEEHNSAPSDQGKCTSRIAHPSEDGIIRTRVGLDGGRTFPLTIEPGDNAVIRVAKTKQEVDFTQIQELSLVARGMIIQLTANGVTESHLPTSVIVYACPAPKVA